MLGHSGIGEDAGIMAAQLDRAAAILLRPVVAAGCLFDSEPAGFTAMLEAHAPAIAAEGATP
jgi:hypothetical protein